jgi:hypothetical protein
MTSLLLNDLNGFNELLDGYIKIYNQKAINKTTTIKKEFEDMRVINQSLKGIQLRIYFIFTNTDQDPNMVIIKENNDDLFEELKKTQMIYLKKILMSNI